MVEVADKVHWLNLDVRLTVAIGSALEWRAVERGNQSAPCSALIDKGGNPLPSMLMSDQDMLLAN